VSVSLFERVLADSVAAKSFSDATLIAAMLRFEIALAQAQARAGVIPGAAAAAIRDHAPSFAPDAEQLLSDGAHSGSLAIPFVKALIAHVGARDAPAARHVHFGATSQDVLDTALVLCTRDAVALLDEALGRAVDAADALANQHATAPMLARSLLQPAGVTTFGFKAAQWALSLARARARVHRTADEALAVSMGGAIGNLAAQGASGSAVRAELARELGLRDPGASWHTQREVWLALATDTALAAGVMGKIARDIALMAQAEVGEVAEAEVPGRGGSTAMPHKRNPVLTMRVIAAVHGIPGMIANLLAAMPQEHERALGSWQAELAQWPGVFVHAVSAARALEELMAGLQVDAARCRANIESLNGLVFAERLTEVFTLSLGKTEAQGLVSELCRRAASEHRHLRDLALERFRDDSRLVACAAADIEAAFDVGRAAQASTALVEPTLHCARALEMNDG
jgi:3-carboxy-cis,cis-muconate cycloisomerase